MGLLVALAGLVAPGLGHGLIGAPRAMALWIAAFGACVIAIPWTPFALWAALAVFWASVIHAGWCYHRRTQALAWSWSWPLVALGATLAIVVGARVALWETFVIPSSSMAPTLLLGDHVVVRKVGRGSVTRGDVIIYHQPCDPARAYVGRVMAMGGDSIEVRCDIAWLDGKALPLALVDATATYEDHPEYSVPVEQHAAASYREVVDGHAHLVFEREDRQPDSANANYDFPGAEDNTCAVAAQESPDFRSNANQAPGKLVTEHPQPEHGCEPFRHYVVPPGHVFVLGDNRGNANDSRFWGSVPQVNIVGRVSGKWWPLSRLGGID